MVLYCLVLFLAFDFDYSTFTQGQEQARAARIYDTVYDHGLAPKFDGYDVWVESRHRLLTNSLGFKDASTRDVPLQSNTRRILLMGDSFVEGIGLPYERTFAGLLNEAGQARTDKVEFLDASVASYSPSIYYSKIKYLLDRGLKFDEVVLLSDSSDVEDEASSYFCVDDDPKYHKYCTTAPGAVPEPVVKRDFFIDHFVVTNRETASAGPPKMSIRPDTSRWGSTAALPGRWQTWRGSPTCSQAAAFPSPSWSIPGHNRSRRMIATAARRQLWRDFCPHR
jgi:hypothetical protein